VAFWQAYRAGLPAGSPLPGEDPPEAWRFGDNPALADELAGLVLRGIKTATCSAVTELEAAGEPIPRAGELSIILDGGGSPVCLIETIQVEIRPFNQVDARFAYDEGEDDRSLESWRREHRRYFKRVFASFGETPSEEMPVVCERFRVIWQQKKEIQCQSPSDQYRSEKPVFL
jgi:uncharacterized protein YhfF